MHARMIASLIAVAGLAGLAGCQPTSGVITAAAEPKSGSLAPDLQYVSAEGKQGDFNKARHPVTVIVFAVPQGANCCWVDPKVVKVVDQLWDLPVTVAQFSLPEAKCPHGQGCVEVCTLHKGGMMSLCDSQRIAWNAYGHPAPGSLILIGPDKKIALTGSLSDPTAVIAEAKRLGQVEKNKNDAYKANPVD